MTKLELECFYPTPRDHCVYALRELITEPTSPLRYLKLNEGFGNNAMLLKAVRSPNCQLRQMTGEDWEVSSFPNHRDALLALASIKTYRRLGVNSHTRVLPSDMLKLVGIFYIKTAKSPWYALHSRESMEGLGV